MKNKIIKKVLISGLRILGTILIIIGIRAGLTKVGIIVNWFDIKILNPYLKDEFGKCMDCNGEKFGGNILFPVYKENGIRCCWGTYSINNNKNNNRIYHGCISPLFSGKENCNITLKERN